MGSAPSLHIHGLAARGLCATFCNTYPDLCQDPATTTLRGNFAAPDGDYYTQFWPDLPGDNDNYLSCGECFQLVRTKKDAPTTNLERLATRRRLHSRLWIPARARPIPSGAVARDVTIVARFRISSTAVRFRPRRPCHRSTTTLYPTRACTWISRTSPCRGCRRGRKRADGGWVIPTRYRRAPCPVTGNIYILLKNGGEYYFAFSVVNVSGLGSLVNVEARLPSGDWVSLIRDPNYEPYRPQERFGTWVLPQGKGHSHCPWPCGSRIRQDVRCIGASHHELDSAGHHRRNPQTVLPGFLLHQHRRAVLRSAKHCGRGQSD